MSQILEIEDFSGGVTDYYLNAPPNKLRSCDNLLLNVYPQMGKPFTRQGSRLFDLNHPQISSAQKINTCFVYKDILYVQSGQKIFFYDKNLGWVDILGPTLNSAIPLADTSVYCSIGHWNFHTFVTCSNYMYPKKIIKGSNGIPFIVEAGLPKFEIGGSNPLTHTDSPPDMSDPEAGPFPPSSQWLYKFVYRYEYKTEGDIQFTDIGATSQSYFVDGFLPVNFQNIKSIQNGPTDNFDTSKIVIDIYRTVSNGSVFYKIGTIPNGQTTYTDNTADESGSFTLTANEPLYTTGGVLNNDRPPRSLCLHIKNDFGYYGNIIDRSNQRINYRICQSVGGDIDSVPESFFVDLDDEVISISSTKSNVISICRHSVYRLDGAYDELGRGEIVAERISDTAGGISPQASVQALDGVFWLGRDGAYFTDGFKVIKLNTDFDQTYKTFISESGIISDAKTFKIQGKYDRKKNRIWWTIQRDGSQEIDYCYILDLNWGISDKSCFTTASGESFSPTAIEFLDGNLIRCDKRGYIFIHEDHLYVDPKIDIHTHPSQWYDETIKFELETTAFNFGTSSSRKFVTHVNVTCVSTTNLSLQIVSNNDDSKVISDLNPIRYRGNIVWGDPDVYWGDQSLDWNKQGLIHEKRRMPARSLRCNFKSIKLSNAKVAIINSDFLGLAHIDSLAKTITLVNSGKFDWPSRSVGYYISFESDNYTREYEVIARSNDVLTFFDLINASVSANNQKWVLRGHPKGEVLNLLNLSLVYQMSGPTLHTFQKSDSGEVGT